VGDGELPAAAENRQVAWRITFISFGLVFEESLRWLLVYLKLRTLLYTSLKGVQGEAQIPYEDRQWQLWRVAAESGEPQPSGLIAARQLVGMRLHPDGRRVAIVDVKVDLEVWVMENFLPLPKIAK